MLTPRTDHLIDLALDEDAGLGDVTSRAIFPAKHTSRAFIEAKQDLVVCGLDVAARVFARVDPALKVTLTARDGDRVKKGGVVLRVVGVGLPDQPPGPGRAGEAFVFGLFTGDHRHGEHVDHEVGAGLAVEHMAPGRRLCTFRTQRRSTRRCGLRRLGLSLPAAKTDAIFLWLNFFWYAY